jgi:hypothetical protein
MSCRTGLSDSGSDSTLDDALHDQELCNEWQQPVVAACGDFTFVIGQAVDSGQTLYYQDKQLVAVTRFVVSFPILCAARSMTLDVPLCIGGNPIPMPLCSSQP